MKANGTVSLATVPNCFSTMAHTGQANSNLRKQIQLTEHKLNLPKTNSNCQKQFPIDEKQFNFLKTSSN